MIKLHTDIDITSAQRMQVILLGLVEGVVIVNPTGVNDPQSGWREAGEEDEFDNLLPVSDKGASDLLTVYTQGALLCLVGEGGASVQHVCDGGHGLAGPVAWR